MMGTNGTQQGDPRDWFRLSTNVGAAVTKAPAHLVSAGLDVVYHGVKSVLPEGLHTLVDIVHTGLDIPNRLAKMGPDILRNTTQDIIKWQPARVPTDASDPMFQDAVFASSQGWTMLSPRGMGLSRYQRRAWDHLFCETKFLVRADNPNDLLHEVVTKLRQPWHFYNGKVTDFEELQDGSGRITYFLYPMGLGLAVFETMGRPLPMGENQVRLPVILQRDANGPAYIELIAHPQSGVLEMTGRFAGVQPGGVGHLFGPVGYATNHLYGEGGLASQIPILGWFLKDGGGLAGLILKNGWNVVE